jgi:hypothetical protein
VTEGKTEGLDPAVVSRFFRAQIEANKVVQSSLLSTWHKAGKSPDHPTKDLTTAIRPQLDEIQKQLIEELVSTAPVRASSTCRLDLAKAVGGYLGNTPTRWRRCAGNRAQAIAGCILPLKSRREPQIPRHAGAGSPPSYAPAVFPDSPRRARL